MRTHCSMLNMVGTPLAISFVNPILTVYGNTSVYLLVWTRNMKKIPGLDRKGWVLVLGQDLGKVG